MLTPRQAEVLGLACDGMAAKEIARVLGISVRTVEGHISSMRQRTGTRNMAELAAWGVRYGFTGHQPPGDRSPTADTERPETGLSRKTARQFPGTDSEPGYNEFPSATRKVGRPTVVTPEVAAQARLLLGRCTVKEAAAKLGVSRSALYAHMSLIIGNARERMTGIEPA